MSKMFEEDFTFRKYFKTIIKHWLVLVVSVAATLLFVYLGLQLQTPEYEASVKMFIIAKKQIDSVFYKDAGGGYQLNQMTLTQSEIVKSSPVIERVVRRLHLDQLPLDYEKKFATSLKSILIDLSTRKLKAKMDVDTPGRSREFNFRDAVESLKKKIKAEPVRDTDIFIISCTDFSALVAAQIANAISRSYCIFDMEQQLAELQQKYGEKYYSVVQLKSTIEKMENGLDGGYLSNLEATGGLASVKIIEQAVQPIKPKGVSKTKIFIAAFVLSLLFGAILASNF